MNKPETPACIWYKCGKPATLQVWFGGDKENTLDFCDEHRARFRTEGWPKSADKTHELTDETPAARALRLVQDRLTELGLGYQVFEEDFCALRDTIDKAVRLAREEEAESHKINDLCPGCKGRTLFLGTGGWLTCSTIGCRSISLRDWLAQARQEALAEAYGAKGNLTVIKHKTLDRIKAQAKREGIEEARKRIVFHFDSNLSFTAARIAEKIFDRLLEEHDA